MYTKTPPMPMGLDKFNDFSKSAMHDYRNSNFPSIASSFIGRLKIGDVNDDSDVSSAIITLIFLVKFSIQNSREQSRVDTDCCLHSIKLLTWPTEVATKLKNALIRDIHGFTIAYTN